MWQILYCRVVIGETMLIKMNEYLQGVGVSGVLVKTGNTVSALEPDGVYEVGDELATYILENHKGVEYLTDKPVHYGAQDKPEFRHDDEKYEQMKAESEAPAEETPIMSTKSMEPKSEQSTKSSKLSKRMRK